MALDLYTEFRSIVGALESAEVDYAIVGALALAIHGVARATKDVDVLVLARNLEAAKAAVATIGYTAPAAPMTFASGVTVHRLSRFEDGEFLTLDFLIADGPLAEIWSTRIVVHSESGQIHTVSREGLIRMKSLSGRLRDLADIESLREEE